MAEKTKIERILDGAVAIALVSLFLGVLAGGGCSPIPTGVTGAAPFVHPIVFFLGVLGGVLTLKRRREVDEWRWHVANDQDATDAERLYAHKEAERRIKWASTVLLLAPVGVGCWLAYQLRDPEVLSLADLLVLSPGIGFLVGILLEFRRENREQSSQNSPNR